MPGKTRYVSMDAAFKSLIRGMDIPRQEALDLLNARLERLEKLLKQAVAPARKTRYKRTRSRVVKGSGVKKYATDVVLKKIKRSKMAVDIAILKAKTGFDEKKLQNILFRLYRLGKIKRTGRGKYAGA